MLEMGAFVTVLSLLTLTALRGPRPTTRPAFWSVFPFIAGSFCSFALASIINLINVAQAVRGLVLYVGDTLNVTLGLFGFLVPMALAMSARSLPMYAGLDSFPRRVLFGPFRPLRFSPGYLPGDQSLASITFLSSTHRVKQ